MRALEDGLYFEAVALLPPTRAQRHSIGRRHGDVKPATGSSRLTDT